MQHDYRDMALHLTLTRLHQKFEVLDSAQAETLASLDMARMQREGRAQWDDGELLGRTALR